MSYPLVFNPGVGPEVDDAYDWYEGRRPGLGDDFLAALDVVFARLRSQPLIHQVVYAGTVRRTRPTRFPYSVFYRVHTDRVEVLAVQHAHRDPADWQSRV